jgi:hypothetical protein
VVGPDGSIRSLTVDRYVDSFNTLDLIVSQDWTLPNELGKLSFKARAKNLTDSVRGIVYDPGQTSSSIPERKFTVGRDFKFSISYSLPF